MFSLKHLFHSPKINAPDSTLVRPSNWNDEHDFQASAGGVFVGRGAEDGPGPMQELPISGIASPAARFEASVNFTYGETELLSLAIDSTVYNHDAGTFSPTGNPDDDGFTWTPGPGLWAVQAQAWALPDMDSAVRLFVVKYPYIGGDNQQPGGWAGYFFTGVNSAGNVSTLVEMAAGDRLGFVIGIAAGVTGVNFAAGPYTFISGYRVRPSESVLTGL